MKLLKIFRAIVLAAILVFSFPKPIQAPITTTEVVESAAPSPATNPTPTPPPAPGPEPEPEKQPEKTETTPPPPPPEKPKAQVKTYTFIISYYTELEGQGKGLTASGKKVAYGMVANNQLKFGTKIQLDGIGTFTVEDRGSPKHFNRVERIDVYIPRQQGESNVSYQKRVRNMGVKEVKGVILE